MHKNKIDSHLVRKAKAELDIANDPENEEKEIEEDPTQQDFDVVPAQAPIEDPTLAESPVKTYPMEDGSMLECYGDEEQGFEIGKSYQFKQTVVPRGARSTDRRGKLLVPDCKHGKAVLAFTEAKPPVLEVKRCSFCEPCMLHRSS